jgi:hypothetical protein
MMALTSVLGLFQFLDCFGVPTEYEQADPHGQDGGGRRFAHTRLNLGSELMPARLAGVHRARQPSQVLHRRQLICEQVNVQLD